MKDAKIGDRISDQCKDCERPSYAHGLCHLSLKHGSGWRGMTVADDPIEEAMKVRPRDWQSRSADFREGWFAGREVARDLVAADRIASPFAYSAHDVEVLVAAERERCIAIVEGIDPRNHFGAALDLHAIVLAALESP